MPDENGELLPGELGGGGYGALEGNLGHRLRPLAGFGRDIEPAGTPQEAFCDSPWDDEEMETYVIPGGFSTGLPVAYVLRGWSC